MIPIYSLLLIVAFSYLVVKAGAVALMLTGLSLDSAMFQAQSAFMGVGFTTRESETVVTHPARRRIIGWLMVMGYLSLGSVLAGLLVNFNQATTPEGWFVRILGLAGGLVGIFLLTRMAFIRTGLIWIFTKLMSSTRDIRVHDYEELLQVDEGFAVAHVLIEPDNWMVGKSLREMRLTDEGVMVLNIVRGGGNVFATPGPDTPIDPGDKLLLYGHEENLGRLAERNRARGEVEHEVISRKHRARRAVEEATDLESKVELSAAEIEAQADAEVEAQLRAEAEDAASKDTTVS